MFHTHRKGRKLSDYEILEKIEVVPDAERGMQAFTHLGYKPQEALADIIDNSIAAKATQVNITNQKLYGSGHLTRTTIADNGIGMSREKLLEAMRFGSRAEKNSELSVYGLGLKSASLQISSRLTVVTRDSSGEESAASWDKTSQATDPWKLEIVKPRAHDLKALDVVAQGGSGTLVIWDEANLKPADPTERMTKIHERTSARIHKSISDHLGMVFHRFLEGTAKDANQLVIQYDGEILQAFNPFDERFMADPEIYLSQKSHFFEDVEIDGVVQSLPYSIQPFQLNDDDASDFYKDSRQEMDYQGIYCYRLDRLIQWPGWLGFVKSPHNDQNKTRLIFEFDPGLTEALQTNVMKTGVQLTVGMFENLRPIVTEVRNVARQKYKKKLKDTNNEATPKDLHSNSSKTIEKTKASHYPIPEIQSQSATRVKLDSKYGQEISLRLKTLPDTDAHQDAIEAVQDLPGGNLWEPYLRGSEIAIRLNRNHDFYQKFYLTNIDKPEAIEAIDLLLWSLARAELHHAIIQDQFEEIRTLVSMDLRRVAEDRPFPNLIEGEGAEENMISPSE